MNPTESAGDGGKDALPPGWEEALDRRTNQLYYVNHNNRTTTLVDPRDSYDAPTAAEKRYAKKRIVKKTAVARPPRDGKKNAEKPGLLSVVCVIS